MTNVTETLEAMVDRHGLLHVLAGLELICGEKADHIRANWQDKTTARAWDAAAKACGAAARKAEQIFP